MEMVLTDTRMEIAIMVSGKKTIGMVKAQCPIIITLLIRAHGKKGSNMEEAYLLSLMVIATMECGRMAKCMGKAS